MLLKNQYIIKLDVAGPSRYREPIILAKVLIKFANIY